MPALHPRRGVRDQRKRGCVAFRKSVTAEPFKLLESLFGERLLVAVGDHAGDAQTHGVEIRPVCINASRWDCTASREGFDRRLASQSPAMSAAEPVS
jgi:hypothetical protein